uniref:Proton-coupled folate transporter n=1 Tax=Arion vulgaris TaxID=1028688 RepID=A0A0B7A7L3_9EUPU
MAAKSGETEPLLASRLTSAESDVDNDHLSLSVRRRAVWTLPLVVMTYFISYYTAVVILNPYLYDLVAEEFNFKRNSSSQQPCTEDHRNTSERTIQETIQKKVSTTELYLSLPCYPFAALSILIVGPLTDKYGRKVGFLFPIIGTFLKQVIYVATVGLHLPPMVLIAGHICEAIGGSFAAMLTSMFTVISDVTYPGPKRSFHITFMEALQTMTGAAGAFAIGQWIRVSYFYPLVFSLVVSIVSLLVTIFILPETVQTHSLVAPIATMYTGLWSQMVTSVHNVLSSCLYKFKRSFVLFINDQCGQYGLAKRRLCLLIFILTVAVNFSTPGIQTLYLMKSPRCWPATRILTFGSIQIVCNWAAILIVMALTQKVFKMADRHIAIIGVVSSMTSAVFMSEAVNDVMVYEVAVLAFMTRAIIPMMRSVMSSVVNSSEQGAVYASMGCVELLGAALFGTIANRVYYATLSTWAGSVFLMFAGQMAIALVLLIFLNLLFLREKNQRTDVTQDVNPGNIQIGPDPSW